jgi:hypothetical protein
LIEFFEQNNIYFDEENRQFKQKWALWLTFFVNIQLYSYPLY